MDLARFTALAEIHGSDLARWPAAERGVARALVASDPAFAAAFAAAIALDEALDLWRTPHPSPALRNAVLASAPTPPQRRGRRIGFWASGAGLAAAAMAGVLCGAAASTAAMAEAKDEALGASATADGLGAFGGAAERRAPLRGDAGTAP